MSSLSHSARCSVTVLLLTAEQHLLDRTDAVLAGLGGVLGLERTPGAGRHPHPDIVEAAAADRHVLVRAADHFHLLSVIHRDPLAAIPNIVTTDYVTEH